MIVGLYIGLGDHEQNTQIVFFNSNVHIYCGQTGPVIGVHSPSRFADVTRHMAFARFFNFPLPQHLFDLELVAPH